VAFFLPILFPKVKRVLLIEDESLIRSSLARALRQDGVVISEAQNCQEAREKLREEGCDLAIVDLFLEDGMHGLRLIPEIYQRSPGARVIVLTAFGTSEVKEDARRAGVDRFYEKPFEIMVIRNAVKELLSGSFPSVPS